jgi:NifU-like protein involved in Fe-S cluster formation/bacterioferritin-associated ferredoxin
MVEDEEKYKADGLGMVGSPACGDMMKMWIKVDKKTERITECKWKTFGCGSAIASTSMLSVIVTERGGMKLEDARKLRPQDILERLGGLPARKIHCSVLGDKALRAAINDYYRKTGQIDRIEVEGAKIIDRVLKITDKDIEEAVLEGADTLEKVQAKTKVGTGDPDCIPEVEQLLRYYKEKYFG